MIYYSVVYMADGQIHLKPFETKEEAEECLEKLKNSEKWGPMIESAKVVKKDTSTSLWKNTKGHWIGA